MFDLPAGLDLSMEQLDQIDRCLDEMLWETEAHCILLADISGQLISEKGTTQGMNTAVLSALAAGELAATNELARLVGEPARFKLLLHEGERQGVYLSDVGEEMILVAVFDISTAIGMVRLYIRKIVKDLLAITQTPPPPKPSKQNHNDGLLSTDDLDDLLSTRFDAFFNGE